MLEITLSPETHGSPDYAELRAMGIDPAVLIDFSVNTNPFGPSPRALAAFQSTNPACYPDREALDLRAALAQLNGVKTENVIAGNGAAELVWLVACALLEPGNTALVIGPSFGEYRRAACAAGARVSELRAKPPSFDLDLDEIVTHIRAERPRLVFLCNPNNPTGLHLPDPDVRRIAEACAPGTLVLDEAYRSFVTRSPFGPPPTGNTLILRSMTKDFALAGLRLGYAIGTPQMVRAMRAIQPPWSVSGPAQAAGLAALGDLDYLHYTLECTRQSARALREGLSALGASVLPAATHYLLIDVGTAAYWRKALLAEGCLVRDCASFGLPQYVRVGARLPEQNEYLLTAWPDRKPTGSSRDLSW